MKEAQHSPEDDVPAVDDEVERGVDDDEEVVGGDDVLGPGREVAPLAVEHVHHLVERDEDLAHVAHDEQHDDADQHERDAAVAPPSRVLLHVRERARRGQRRAHHLPEVDGYTYGVSGQSAVAAV